MEKIASKLQGLPGGAFIVDKENLDGLFFPEYASEDQRMIVDALSDFINTKIKPKIKDIERGEFHHSVAILEEMGEMGFLGIHMPEAYGGMEMDENTDVLVNELFGGLHSFNVSFSVQVGIGMLPILYFGRPDQKDKYLTKIISGEIKSAYCLTEPTSGSDALSAKTTATLSSDKDHFILNGQKMWISNSGFANLFIVFAQIDGNKFTGFIVDANSPGISLGAEEDKMGIHGSSTRQVYFENVKVPLENVLGEIGQGHKIAFNVLNIGRLKLGVLCIGGSKNLVNLSVQYAKDRQQFKTPIAQFGAIKYKLAEQVIRTYAGESALYRTSSALNNKAESLKAQGVSYGEAKLQAAQEYAIECAILKVYGSEVIDYVVDEAVQIHGGMGFSEESEVAMAYRNARINRIFEGTNEINRLLSINMLTKHIQKGLIDFQSAEQQVAQALTDSSTKDHSDTLSQEIQCVKDFKHSFLFVSGAIFKEQLKGNFDLSQNQEVAMNLSDILIDVYVAEAIILRLQKLNQAGQLSSEGIEMAIAKVFLHDAQTRIHKHGLDAIASVFDDETLSYLHQNMRKLASYPIQNVLKYRRKIADETIKLGKYPLT